MRLLILALPALLLACGPAGSGTASASRASTPPHTPAASAPPAAAASPPSGSALYGQLFVVLESSSGSLLTPDTIAIVGVDGVAVAKTRFKPRSTPWILPDMGVLLPQVAHLAAGRAYFIDGEGVVRSLGPAGDVREETRFPVTSSQQEVSFAVSLDAHDLVGSVVTLPPEPDPPPTPGWFPSTPYTMDVMTARAGSPATVAYHRTWTYRDNMGSGAQFVGWDNGGPIATTPSNLGTQGGGLHQWNGTTLVHFPGGRPGPALPAPDGCSPMDLGPTGAFVCSSRDGRTLSVVGPNGVVQWAYTPTDPNGFVTYGFLSANSRRVVAFGSTSTVFSASDPPIALAGGFTQSGWIDAYKIAGTATNGNFAYVSLDSPQRVVDLGFKGSFVGHLLP